MTEFLIIGPSLCLLFAVSLFLNDLTSQKLHVEIAKRNLSGLHPPTEEEEKKPDYQKALISQSGLQFSRPGKLNQSYLKNLQENKDSLKFRGKISSMNRREATWKDQRSEFLKNLSIPSSKPYDYIGSTETYLSQWYTRLLLDQISYIMIDDTASTLKVQVDYQQPLELFEFGESLQNLLDMIRLGVNPESQSGGEAGQENPPTEQNQFFKSIAFSTLGFAETQSGYHPDHYISGGLMGYAFYGMFKNTPHWMMKSRDFSTSINRLKQGFSRACPFEFRANSECSYSSIFSASLYAQIIVFVAESAGAADIIAAFFTDEGSTALKKAAWEAVKKGVKEAGKEMVNKFEQAVKDKVKDKVQEISTDIKDKVQKELKEKFEEMTKKIKDEYLTKEKFLEWIGIGS